jgi:hypothetical protein
MELFLLTSVAKVFRLGAMVFTFSCYRGELLSGATDYTLMELFLFTSVADL